MSNAKYRISAKGFFFNKLGQVLLVKGKTLFGGRDFWCAPGGGVEEGENIYVACERELTEETGHFGKAQKIVFVQDFEFQNSGRNIEIFMVGDIDELKTPVPGHDHEFRFFGQTEFSEIFFLPEDVDPFELQKHNGAEYSTYLE